MEIIKDFLHSYVFIGPQGALVEGVKKINRWQEDCIEVISQDKIVVCGKNLRVENKSMDSLLVKGNIEKIEFIKRNKRGPF